jgi:hypothetical protein
MQTDSIVVLLIQERDKLTRAIEALQGPTKRIGRPPKNPQISLASATPAAPTPVPEPLKRKSKFSAAQRKAFGERMKAYWTARRAAAEPKVGKGKKTAK